MRGLMVAVIGMGILIVAGVSVLVMLLVQRMSSVPSPNASPPIASGPTMNVPGATPLSATLNEPAGTHIVGTALAPDRMLLQLSGGGPDRVVLLDGRGHVLARIAIAP